MASGKKEGWLRPKENRYVPGRQTHIVEVASRRGGRPYVNRQVNGEWQHTAPGGGLHAGCWQTCTTGTCTTLAAAVA